MQSQPTNHLTKPNQTQQQTTKKTTTSLTNQPIHTDTLGTYFKRARAPLVLPNVAHRID